MLAEGVKYSFLLTLFYGMLDVGVFSSLIIDDSSSIPSSSGMFGCVWWWCEPKALCIWVEGPFLLLSVIWSTFSLLSTRGFGGGIWF